MRCEAEIGRALPQWPRVLTPALEILRCTRVVSLDGARSAAWARLAAVGAQAVFLGNQEIRSMTRSNLAGIAGAAALFAAVSAASAQSPVVPSQGADRAGKGSLAPGSGAQNQQPVKKETTKVTVTEKETSWEISGPVYLRKRRSGTAGRDHHQEHLRMGRPPTTPRTNTSMSWRSSTASLRTTN